MAAKVNFQNIHNLLGEFRFHDLFVEELNWGQPDERDQHGQQLDDVTYDQTMLAKLGGVGVYQITASGDLPDAKWRRKLYEVATKEGRAETLLIFVDEARRRSIWYWGKRANGKLLPREHEFVKGQPGDLFISKLVPLIFDLSDYEVSGGTVKDPDVSKVAERLRDALDNQRVTRKFYDDFKLRREAFTELIVGIPSTTDRAWYASVILNRLMFVYFLQKKGFIDSGEYDYLNRKLAASKSLGADRFYREFLLPLFFKGFAVPEGDRDAATNALLGQIKYLNGGLFLPHPIEQKYDGMIQIPDRAFENMLALFKAYSWNLNDTPGGEDNEINPDVLGYIFEKYINQKDFGAYYTRPQITEYLGERTIHRRLLDRLKEETGKDFGDEMGNVTLHLTKDLCRALINILAPRVLEPQTTALPLTVLDPACGSGAFLVAAMKVVFVIYRIVADKIKHDYKNDTNLMQWVKRVEGGSGGLNYGLKKLIITNNLYGVDVMEEATEIAKLRLFLTLVASADSVDELEPLPNIDFNILAGNSLIGLLTTPQSSLPIFGATGSQSFGDLLKEKDTKIAAYRDAATYSPDLTKLRNDITALRQQTQVKLNNLLLEEFNSLKPRIYYEQHSTSGRPTKRALTAADIAALEPFHWGYEFADVMQRGGFDVIITNPPWEVFRPEAKEFFADYSDLVTKKKMTIEEFEQQRAVLLGDPEVAEAWAVYQSQYPHVNAYLRSTKQYKNQSSQVNGRQVGSDLNLYKLFVEQCYNLLRDGGECGVVLPSSIYTDLGTMQMRKMLFDKTYITGLFGFENRKEIFENVDSRFKFVVLTYGKGGATVQFPAAFMRHDVDALAHFPASGSLIMPVDLIYKLSPDSLSIMEFDSDLDWQIAKTLLKFPLLGSKVEGRWNLTLGREFHMTDDSYLFKQSSGEGRLPLYEGRMIHQFTHLLGTARYWIDVDAGRKAVLKRKVDTGQVLDYQTYRLGFRKVARNTDTRTLISTILPPNNFCSENFQLVERHVDDAVNPPNNAECLYLVGMWNSFVVDWLLRKKVTAAISMFYIYQLPIPRYTAGDHPYYEAIVERAGQLICTTPEYDDLAREVGLAPLPLPQPLPQGAGSLLYGVTNPSERAKLRAELDAMVAHIYGLTETEFAHILSTFPIVAASVKEAALDEYRRIAPQPGDEPEIVALIKAGEGLRFEFKQQAVGEGANKVARAVASLLNTWGGSVLVGVEDGTGVVRGVEGEYASVNSSKPNHDGYTLWLGEKIAAALVGGAAYSSLLDFSYHRVQGHDVCRITVRPASGPVYMNDGSFQTRNAGGSKSLSAMAAEQYKAEHWPK